MEENYYETTLAKLRAYMAQKDYFKALEIISEELKMPYMPKDFEEELRESQRIIQKALQKGEGELSSEEIATYLKGDSYKQFLAIKSLEKLNLRDYLDMIRDYLVFDGDEKAKTVLVALLIEQEIGEEFTIKKRGLEITFIPKYVENVAFSDAYKEGVAYLKDKLENDDPIMYKMAVELLGNYIFSELPLSVSEEEGLFYAKAIIVYLLESFGKSEEKEAFLENEILLKEREALLEAAEGLKSA